MRKYYWIVFIFCGLQPMGVKTSFAQNTLEQIFANPPVEARPRGYWLWPHGNFDYTRIKEELQAFQEMGLGGVDIFDMGIKDPLSQIPAGNTVMGQKMMDGILFANHTAKKLGLKLGLSVSNGWNAGGPWTPPDEMIMQLLFWKDTVAGPIDHLSIGFPTVPVSFDKPYGTFQLFPQLDEEGRPKFYQDVGLFAYPLTDSSILHPEEVQTFNLDNISRSSTPLHLPAGNWVLVRAVVCPYGQKQWMRSDNSEGFIMDHFSQKATRNHFNYIIERLEARLGDLDDSALERLYLASFESESYILWTPEFKVAFAKQHGYSLDPYLPVFLGKMILDESTSQRFMHDYISTVSELFIQNHYRQARDICHAHGLLLASESGGPGLPLHFVPTEDLKALGSVDVMRGEFWNKKSEYFDEHGNDLLQVVKNIASAAHIYGHKVVEMEAFTSHGKHWDERPIELKRLADRAFCEGMTRVVYHTMPHSPKEAGVPGWSYGAGTHISPKMAWWPLSKPFHSYLARTSALLQAGHFVADVAYFYGEQIPKFASGSKFIRKSLGHGYDYDDLNKEVLLQSSVDEKGRIVLPSGMTYHLLVLSTDSIMSLPVLKKIESLIRDGATVLGKPPITVPGLHNWEQRELQLQALVRQIWGPERLTMKMRNYGKGKIIVGYDERDILLEMGVFPDFLYRTDGSALDFIHRKTMEEDIYFIRNTDSVHTKAVVDARVIEAQPLLFDPVSGKIIRCAAFTHSDGRTQTAIQLPPYGSTFLIFRERHDDARFITSWQVNGENMGLPSRVEYHDDAIMMKGQISGVIDIHFNDGTSQRHDLSDEQNILIDNSWSVHFPYGWGFDPIQEFDQLLPWNEHFDAELRSFSGLATYKTSFQLEETCDQMVLDLGRVGVAARVYLNGAEIGTSVFSPYQFDVSAIAQPGQNHLEIEVASTWLNQLVAESSKEPGTSRTNSNLANQRLRDDGTAEFYRLWENKALQPSGLIGPVQLRCGEVLSIRP